VDSNDSIKVAVLMGGIGSERQVSLESGRCVCEGLEEAGFEVVGVDVGPERLEILDDETVDVFFPALHGEFGEDGQLQQILEDRSLRYAGSGPEASRLAFDKLAAKEVFQQVGVATARAIQVGDVKQLEGLSTKLADFADKYVIKPIRQGSSVGVSIVEDPDEAVVVLEKTLERFGQCLVEQYIAGREVTVGILGDRALPIIEIRPVEGFYDYQAKYIDERTEYLFDTIAEPAVVNHLQQAALRCFRALGCRHFGRVDFILGQDSCAYALEVNTIPGFTKHSLLPKAAAKAGLSMSQLCARIVRQALAEVSSQRVSERTIEPS